MRRAVSLAVPILPIFPWHRILEGNRHVPPHIGIGSLLNRHPRRCVGDDHLQQPIPPTSPCSRLFQDLS